MNHMEYMDYIPIPDLLSCKNLLCVQPHPDDNEVGAGATIAKLSQKGCDITYLTVTNGSRGTEDPNINERALADIRKKEAEKAADLLGVHSRIFLDFEDGGYLDEMQLRRSIISVMRKVKPEFVLTVDPFLPYEVHPDHRRVGMAVAEVCMFGTYTGEGSEEPDEWSRSISGIVFHSTAYPNTFIDVDETWELKIKAILAHRSQFSSESFKLLGRYFDNKSRQYAEGRSFMRAEAFKVLPPILLHMCVDTINL
jgi:LmbE family N-acetylglucosaminyl deacetylase